MPTDFFSIGEKEVSHLAQHWSDLTASYTADEDLKSKSFKILRDKYNEAGRFYHNLSHIKALLSLYEAVKHIIQDKNSIRFAIWFHDAIYDTRKADNEDRSAELASEVLSDCGIPEETIAVVRALILATKAHTDMNLSHDGKLFLDLDLSILGASSEVYEEYSKAIRKEYSWVPSFLYRNSRKKILKGFVDRKSIYLTKEMNNRFETQARINVDNEIKTL